MAQVVKGNRVTPSLTGTRQQSRGQGWAQAQPSPLLRASGGLKEHGCAKLVLASGQEADGHSVGLWSRGD